MKKLAILSAVLGGFTFMAVGCTSHEAQQTSTATPVEQAAASDTQSSSTLAPAASDAQPSIVSTTAAPASDVQ
ncbi:hypothetical protein [Acinetobacter sp. MD2]|uniref:hypothetical protein n=1 Tax=Acinetobacter sp. MD2 TaxID=2600066 RepID=UPI002D1E51F5|nr:hypothetical protein [Acinetobacter sp. MD2]MEB3768358.1 hypothetical protein [Acinetobacter sp. MD2]